MVLVVAVGWTLAIAALAGIREKMKYSDVPHGLTWLRYYIYHCWFNGFGVYVLLGRPTLIKGN